MDNQNNIISDRQTESALLIKRPRIIFKYTLTLFILLSIFSMHCNQQVEEGNNVQPLAKRLDNYIQKTMNRFDIPGLTIAITQKGKHIYTRAFGVRNLDTGEAMKPEYIFHMASVSKPFAATAIMQLVEKGKINLDATLVTYLPYFKLADENYKKITIRQMLNHTSGMPDVRDYEWDKPQYDEGAAERYVRSLVDDQMIGAPGEKFRYSNMAFDVLADVIAKVSGDPFEIYVKKNILNPIGMKESNFLREEISTELRTSPHVWYLRPVVNDVYPYNRRHAPSSTLNSSVTEMLNWAEVNLNHGIIRDTQILSRDSYDLLYGPSVKVDDKSQVGLSWFLSTHRGTPTISHGGGDTGYRSYFLILPEKNTGVIIASNYDRTPIGAIADAVLDILLDHEPVVQKISIGFQFALITATEGIDSAKDFYNFAYKNQKDIYNFGHRELNIMGYYFLQNEKTDSAIDILKFNVELFPEEANTYDSLGEAYMIAGDNKNAIKNYQKSLELNPENSNAVAMLKKLQTKIK